MCNFSQLVHFMSCLLFSVSVSVRCFGVFFLSPLFSHTHTNLTLDRSNKFCACIRICLCADFFSVIFAVALFSAYLVPLYYVAFICIMIGMFIYNLADHGYSLQDMWVAVTTCTSKSRAEAESEAAPTRAITDASL